MLDKIKRKKYREICVVCKDFKDFVEKTGMSRSDALCFLCDELEKLTRK